MKVKGRKVSIKSMALLGGKQKFFKEIMLNGGYRGNWGIVNQ